jgi:hypothetical protein
MKHINQHSKPTVKQSRNKWRKIIISTGQAAYGMRNWQLAIDHYSPLLQLSPHFELASEELKKRKIASTN